MRLTLAKIGNKSRVKTMVLALFIGLLVIQGAGEIYNKYVLNNLAKREFKAEVYRFKHSTNEDFLKTEKHYQEHYDNLLLPLILLMRTISMFVGGIVMGYIVGKGGWKFATAVIILLFLLQDLPVVIQGLREANQLFWVTKY